MRCRCSPRSNESKYFRNAALSSAELVLFPIVGTFLLAAKNCTNEAAIGSGISLVANQKRQKLNPLALQRRESFGEDFRRSNHSILAIFATTATSLASA